MIKGEQTHNKGGRRHERIKEHNRKDNTKGKKGDRVGICRGLSSLVLMGIWTKTGHAQLFCTFEQITNSSGGENARPSINPDGTLIAFESEVELVPMNNSDLNFEIFLFNTVTDMLTQITVTEDTTDTEANAKPSINSDGTRIAFRSSADLDPDVGNTDSGSDIFLFDTTNGITQITQSLPGTNTEDPSISSNGTRISFTSTEDITGDNSDNNGEIFLFDRNTSTFTQVTNSTGADINGSSSIDSDGSHIAFAAFNDLTGDNLDGNSEIFLAVCSPDVDGDGVPNDQDACPNSDLNPTVVIDGCDSGAENDVDSNGCTVSDLIAEIAAGSANHGQFVRGVASLTNNLKKAGVITESEKDAIQDCAGQADIP